MFFLSKKKMPLLYKTTCNWGGGLWSKEGWLIIWVKTSNYQQPTPQAAECLEWITVTTAPQGQIAPCKLLTIMPVLLHRVWRRFFLLCMLAYGGSCTQSILFVIIPWNIVVLICEGYKATESLQFWMSKRMPLAKTVQRRYRPTSAGHTPSNASPQTWLGSDSELIRIRRSGFQVRIGSESGQNQVKIRSTLGLGEVFAGGRGQRGRYGWNGSVAPRKVSTGVVLARMAVLLQDPSLL